MSVSNVLSGESEMVVTGKGLPQVLGARLLLDPLPAQEKIGSIYLPESGQERPDQGVVVAIGSGSLTEDGRRVPIDDVEVGDVVLYRDFSGQRVKAGDKEYVIVNYVDVLAVVPKEDLEGKEKTVEG